MPTYDYRCKSCSHEFELFQSMTAPVKRTCPACGKPKLERLIGTGAGIIFKGGGFYQTDYRSESYQKAKEAESKAQSPESKGGKDAPAESKTDANSATNAAKPSADGAKPSKGGGEDAAGGGSKPAKRGEAGPSQQRPDGGATKPPVKRGGRGRRGG